MWWKTHYRIVRDRYCGFEVQQRRWWWPVWTMCGFTNTHSSVERAEQWLEGYRGVVVKIIKD
jgi:hypothetical protein